MFNCKFSTKCLPCNNNKFYQKVRTDNFLKDYDVLMSFHVKQPQIYFFYSDLNIPNEKKKRERDDQASVINVPVCKLLIKTAI